MNLFYKFFKLMVEPVILFYWKRKKSKKMINEKGIAVPSSINIPNCQQSKEYTIFVCTRASVKWKQWNCNKHKSYVVRL